jgi:hypothetical protein
MQLTAFLRGLGANLCFRIHQCAFNPSELTANFSSKKPQVPLTMAGAGYAPSTWEGSALHPPGHGR